jgi:aryl-alcohol dehydrogenase-like predicted oxidoreductase
VEYRTLGRSGLRVSAVGLGTWAFNAKVYGDVERGQALTTIAAALDQGINFFDTAPLYGSAERDGIAEEILGAGLKGRRQDVLISTKFGRKPTEGNQANFYAAYAAQSVEESLKRLGTDYIDLLFFHSPFGPEEINDDIWEGLARLKQQGKVRYIGHSISKFAETCAMARQWAADGLIDAVQVVYSLLNREAASLIKDLGADGVGVVARESLANGFLSGKVKRDTVFPPGTLNARYSREEIGERVDQIERLGFLLRDPVQSMPQAAMRWVLDDAAVSLVLTGARNAAEVDDCAFAAQLPAYTNEEKQEAHAVHRVDFSAA